MVLACALLVESAVSQELNGPIMKLVQSILARIGVVDFSVRLIDPLYGGFPS